MVTLLVASKETGLEVITEKTIESPLIGVWLVARCPLQEQLYNAVCTSMYYMY